MELGTPQLVWPRKKLVGRMGKAEGISNVVVEDKLRITQEMERKGEPFPFPSSDQQLYSVLNENLPERR